MRDILLISPLVSKFGPIARSLIHSAPHLGIDVGFIGDSVEKYDNIIYFINDVTMIPKHEDKNVGWYMCDLRDPRRLKECKTDLSAIFLCNTEYTDGYSVKYNCPVFYTPQCGDDTPVSDGRDIEHDVVFIGNLINRRFHANRDDILKRVQKEFKIRVISGESYTPDSPWLYNKSFASLAISIPASGYTSNRLYNILSAGGFCVTNYFPGIEDLFINHKHLVWYEDEDELMDILNHYYYKDRQERNVIAEDGNLLYLDQHTATVRLNSMFNTMKQLYEKTN